MKLFLLGIRSLREDLIKLILLSLGIPALNLLLLSGSRTEFSETTTSHVLSLLFGSVRNNPLNWIYWMILCFGYLLLLQIVWKPNVQTFEVYQILRYRNVSLYWRAKFILGFVLTVFYVLCFLAVTFAGSLLWDVHAVWDVKWLAVLVCLILNLYLHALTWLAIKVYSLVEAALVLAGLMFYAGVRLTEPYIPLYYAMIDHLHPNLWPAFAVELLLILVAMALIIWRVRLKDLV